MVKILADSIPTVVLSLLLAVLFVHTAQAQNADSERVIRSWIDQVKLDDGSKTEWRHTVTYNRSTGEFVRTVVDSDGTLIERTVETSSLIRPSDEEIEIARRIIFADEELRSLFHSATNPELSGGFALVREEGHPCGPGSRCLQFDMFDVDESRREVDRIRYVVVDLRREVIVSDNFDPANNGNETRFNRDRRTN